DERLSYPVTYWNALGLLASLGIVLVVHLTTDFREPRWLRVASAAAAPLLGATILLTFSRGGIAACILGLAAYLLLGRPRGALTGLAAVAPLTAVAVRAAYDATLVASTTYTRPAAVAQGHHLARVVLLCAGGAAVLRAVLLVV